VDSAKVRTVLDAPSVGRAGVHQAVPQAGWHWIEWLCEFAGTALLLLGGLSAVCLDFGSGSAVTRAIPSHSARLLITGLLFAGTGSLVAITPWGRRSGAHLNPVVTLSFWLRGHVHPHDLVGYIGAQIAGAFAGTALIRLLWGHVATSVKLGVTQPGRGLDAFDAALVEGLMTALLVATIFTMVASPRRARWTPLALWPTIAILVWQGAPYTGTSLNPARSLAPAAMFPLWSNFGVYLVGPVLGGLVAVAVFGFLPGVETLTAKLYHDPAYPSPFGSALPVAAAKREPHG
jgi:aquaporin Z